MRSIIITTGALALSLGITGCGAPAANNGSVNAKPANAASNVAANTTNTAANTASATAAAPAIDGQVLKLEEAGIQLTVPKGFKFSKDGGDTIIMSEDEGVDIRFSIPADGDYEKAVADASKELDDYLNDIKIDESGNAKRDISGMEGTSLSGTAKDEDGDAVVFNLTIIDAPKKPVLANIYAVQSSLDKNAAMVKACLDSIRKM